MTNNLAIDESRSNRGVTDLDEAAWKQIEELRSDGQADPEEVALQRERLDRIHAAVLKLTELQRDCLHLRAEGLRSTLSSPRWTATPRIKELPRN